MVSDNLLLIRADANARMGTGHLMRCLALAQAWQAQGGEAIFVTACENTGLLGRLRDEGLQVIRLERAFPDADDWAMTSQVLVAHPGAWVVLDGYNFDPSYQLRVKEAGHPLLVIDDMAHLDHYYADVVLNQNLHAAQLTYSCEPYTCLLLGTRYVLLRREFWPWCGWQREIPDIARKVLVTLGGADPDNVTFKIVQALRQVDVDGLEVVVVIGASNPHHQELEFAVRHSPFAIRLENNVTNMPELMAWADVAISAGGSTCWELAFMGLPNLALILSDNQRPVAEGLGATDVAVNLGLAASLTPHDIAHMLAELGCAFERRTFMARRGRELVDDLGAARVVQHMQGPQLTLRPAQEDDVRLIWEWANDGDIRAASFSSEPIPWRTHERWFTAILTDPQSLFYVVLDAHGTPVGQVRYRIEAREATISVSLAPGQRGRGYGSQMIRLASRRVFEATPVNLIHAYIRPDNVASLRAFASAGFIHRETVEAEGHPACHFVLQDTRL
jgi:UDP-2,4-diacetamido-2,4,6-trideoxy-beta-L-altropyranose hydrolase